MNYWYKLLLLVLEVGGFTWKCYAITFHQSKTGKNNKGENVYISYLQMQLLLIMYGACMLGSSLDISVGCPTCLIASPQDLGRLITGKQNAAHQLASMTHHIRDVLS